jgi:hypothetical protein
MDLMESKIHDLSFTEHGLRQWQEISPERIQERATLISPSGNFLYKDRKWLPKDYPGFAVLSMVDANPGNEGLREKLIGWQEHLLHSLEPGDTWYGLPAASFHLTIANTLSGPRFRENILDPGLDAVYPHLVSKTFAGINQIPEGGPISMHLVGLSIFGTSLGLLGIFEQETEYARIIQFRHQFYRANEWSDLGIKMTRPFIGHITLVYLEKNIDLFQRDRLAAVVNQINGRMKNGTSQFKFSIAELRRYQHLAQFTRASHYPVHLF